MTWPRLRAGSVSLFFIVVCLPLSVPAQTDCDEGNSHLNSAQPEATSPQEIIRKFADKEAIFKEARNHYTYTQEVIVQELDGNTVGGEFRDTTDILYDDHGRRLEQVKYESKATLQHLSLTTADSYYYPNPPPIVLPTHDIPLYNMPY